MSDIAAYAPAPPAGRPTAPGEHSSTPSVTRNRNSTAASGSVSPAELSPTLRRGGAPEPRQHHGGGAVTWQPRRTR